MSDFSEIRTVRGADDAALTRCFPVVEVLRPHLTLEEFIKRTARQFEEGYRMVYLEDEGDVAAMAGYRVATFLAWGRVLYVDDLITAPNRRSRGYGGLLLDYLIGLSEKLECDEVHLDSGHQRFDAHRLYLNKGFRLTSHHFSRPAPAGSAS